VSLLKKVFYTFTAAVAVFAFFIVVFEVSTPPFEKEVNYYKTREGVQIISTLSWEEAKDEGIAVRVSKKELRAEAYKLYRTYGEVYLYVDWGARVMWVYSTGPIYGELYIYWWSPAKTS